MLVPEPAEFTGESRISDVLCNAFLMAENAVLLANNGLTDTHEVHLVVVLLLAEEAIAAVVCGLFLGCCVLPL
jgi:hypothetical protein